MEKEERLFRQFLKDLPEDIAVILEGITEEAFDSESWEGVKWPARKDGDTGRSLLIGHDSGSGMKGGLRFEVGTASVTVLSHTDYAEIHNEGGEIVQTLTAKQKGYFKYRAMNAGSKSEKMMWFGLAAKNTLKIKIPKRQFVGESVELDRALSKHIDKELNRIFK